MSANFESRSPASLTGPTAANNRLQTIARHATACCGVLNSFVTRRNLEFLGAVLLIGALVGGIISLNRKELVGIKHTWFPVPCMACDFDLGTYGPSRFWWTGDNPYTQNFTLGGEITPDTKLSAPLIYPAFVLRCFMWCKFFSITTAYNILLVLLILSAIAGTLYSLRCRDERGDTGVGPIFASAAFLLSTPVLFGLERGNYDLLVVPILIAGTILLRLRTPTADICAGMILAAAPWLKAYPGLIGVALLATRNWRAFAAYVGMAGFIGIMDLPHVLLWLKNNGEVSANSMNLAKYIPYAPVHSWWHSLTQSWVSLWTYVPWPLNLLKAIPGPIAAAAILLPPLFWTSWKFFQDKHSERLIFPFMLWITALGSFFPPVANDYSLVCLPLAAFALWSNRDHWSLKVGMFLFVICWQPVALPINGRLLLIFKVVGLLVTGACLLKRLYETEQSFKDDSQVDNSRQKPSSLAAAS